MMWRSCTVGLHGTYSYKYLRTMSEVLEELEESKEICSNCFRKSVIFVPSDEMVSDLKSKSVKNMVADGRFPGKESEICYPTTASFNDIQSSGIACKCGVIDTNTKIRPITKENMMEYSRNLIERLEERGYSVDENEFYDVVRSMKEDPANQFNDRDIFATAVEDSIIYG